MHTNKHVSAEGRACRNLNVGILFEDDPQVLCLVDAETVGMMVADHGVHRLQLLEA